MYLNTHTYYSLRYGTLSVQRLLELAQKNAIKTLVLTDINNTSACLDFVRMAPEYGVKPIVGVDFRNGASQQFILIAKNNHGFQQINGFLSGLLLKNTFKVPEKAPFLEDVAVVYPLDKHLETEEVAANEFIGVKAEDLTSHRMMNWSGTDKLVLLQTVSFANKKDYNAHRLLRAIDNNTLLSKLPASEQGSETDVMHPESSLKSTFKDYPSLIENTKIILEQSSIDFQFNTGESENQKSYTANQVLDFKLMRHLAFKGLHYRYKNPGKRVFVRLEKELSIIREKGFVSYFLINWKILKYARSKGYFYVGRGSGANSIVAYLLRITDVDPVELDLYFERFINLYRKNPPDFDIDFSWTDRDDVTDFIFNRFPNTALITVYNTFQYKAAIREMGKVFGLPKHEIDKLSSGKFNQYELDKLSKLVLVYAELIHGFPNYLGIHAGGIVISDKPIHYFTATFMPPKGYPTTQFDMVVAEDVGLYKFDILSQRGLGKIKDAVGIVRQNHPEKPPIDIHDIQRFKRDPKIKYLLKNAKAIGCFYVESPAMRMLLKKLQVETYLGLVAASSVIRPGVAKSGMMREFILRYRFPEKRKDAHPVLLDIMPETYGVMVYQEDVIKVAHYFGGLTLGEADMLRRGMSGKFRSRDEFEKVKKKFFDNCLDNGQKLEVVQEIWRQIESFAGYAFAKGHSASYAVESYQSLFLKAYYPLEYMVATINNFGGFYRTELYVHEARMHGADIQAPCINNGRYWSSIQGKTIYLGFVLIKSFESKIAQKIEVERTNNGPFIDLDDFIDRVPISIEHILLLIKVNALRFTGRNKRELLWESHMKIKKIKMEEHVFNLFKNERIQYDTPRLLSSDEEDAFDAIELIGFPLCNPFDLLVAPIKKHLLAADLPLLVHKKVTVYGYLVTTKYTKTSNHKIMHFGTFLDVKGDFLDTVHFPPSVAKYPFRGRGIYAITGKVMVEFDCVNIEVEKMQHLAIIEDPRYADEKPKQLSNQAG